MRSNHRYLSGLLRDLLSWLVLNWHLLLRPTSRMAGGRSMRRGCGMHPYRHRHTHVTDPFDSAVHDTHQRGRDSSVLLNDLLNRLVRKLRYDVLSANVARSPR